LSADSRIRFGICTDQNLSFPALVERWQEFERLGFDSVWDCDHFNQPSRPTGPYFEGWTLLAALAARTERIRVGVLVSCNTFRHPALLAQQAVTVDHISNGRLELGLGAGWFAAEHERFGIPFPVPGELVGRFHEAVQVLDSLLRDETTTFAGRHYRLDGAYVRPGPVQKPRPPLTLGAHKSRMLGICARYADSWNSHGTVAELAERGQILDEHCARIGRDPREIRRSFYGWASQMAAEGLPDPWQSAGAFEDVVGRYREVGINEFIFDQPRPEQFPVLEEVATDVVPRLRDEAATEQ
jgi:alkanesulfonate monooxygenase SsuD/methylene tetrahydromethanopterin reductase-like flavin-dependent oxidoreductase (luciferase family)